MFETTKIQYSRLMESYDILHVRVNVRGEKSMVLLKIQSYAVINWYKNDAGSGSKINDTTSEEERQWNGHWQRFNGFQPPLTFFFSFPPPFFFLGLLSRERFLRVLEREKEKRKSFCRCFRLKPIHSRWNRVHSSRNLKISSGKLWKYKLKITSFEFYLLAKDRKQVEKNRSVGKLKINFNAET